jgi:hypothetical protein
MVLQKVKTLIQRLYKIDSDFKLSYTSQKVSSNDDVFYEEFK